jgi:hypothetical protein
MDNVGRLKDGVRSSKFMLWLAAKKAQKRIELLIGHHSLQKFSRQAYVTSLYFKRAISVFITNCSSRYMGAFNIALSQYKLSKLASKLADAIRLLELVIELDLMYYGDNSAVTEEDRKLCLQLKEGYIP